MKSIVFRYILGELLGPLILGILVFSGILLGNVLFRSSDILLSGGLKVGDLLDMILCSVPFLISLTVPMALLLAILLTYGRLTERNEILALSASGVGYFRVFAPALATGILFFGFMLYWENWVGPAAYHLQRQTLLKVLRYALPPGIRESSFNTKYEDFTVYVKRIEPETRSFRDVAIFRLNKNKISDAVFSPLASVELEEDLHSLAFRLKGGSIHHFGKDVHVSGPFEEALFHIDIRGQIRKLTGQRNEKEGLSTSELRTQARRIDQRLKSGMPLTLEEKDLPSGSINLWREYFSRFSLPAICLVLPWIATPLAFFTRTGRKSHAFAMSLLVIFACYLLLGLGKALTLNGFVSPFLGCWMPVIFLAIFGAVLTPIAASQ
jgi:lipopolysaccharide export system permease protein